MTNLNNSNFTDTINSETPVLVDFWASWCKPCLMLAPVLDEIAEARTNGEEIFKLNVDDNQDISAQYNVHTIPTLILFKNGAEVERMVGVRPKEDITGLLDRFR